MNFPIDIDDVLSRLTPDNVNDPNMRYGGETFLGYCTRQNNVKAVERLLQLGVDVGLRSCGWPPLQVSLINGLDTCIFDLILSYHPNGGLEGAMSGEIVGILNRLYFFGTDTIDRFVKVLEIAACLGKSLDGEDYLGYSLERHFLQSLFVDAKLFYIAKLIDFGFITISKNKSYTICAQSIIQCRVKSRESALIMLQLKRRTSRLLGPGNGRDVLRILSQHIWSKRMWK